MTNKEFESLGEKFNHGDCTDQELVVLKKLAEDNLNFEDCSTLENFNLEERAVWNRLNVRLKAEVGNDFIFKYHWLAASLVASLLIFFCFYAFEDFIKGTEYSSTPTKGVETKNNANSQQKITLPDGSQVLLGKNARIVIAENFGIKTRTVYLTGEAFFNVTKNEKNPFLVHVDNLITEVIGTSFKISKPNADKLIEVSVKSGKVSVYSQDQKSGKKLNGVILTPNQKAIFNMNSKTINETIVDVPLILLTNIRNSDFVFNDADLKGVFMKIQQVYGIEIILINSNINHCVFTGDLNGLDIFKQLEFICSSINANYEVRGSSVFINGEGCK